MSVKTRVEQPKSVEPHPVLFTYYADQTQRPAFVCELFDQTARDYDRINHLLSLGSGSWYRQRALRRAGLRPGMRVLDVATGTGLVARQAVKVTGNQNDVIGLDISSEMLAEARRRLGIELIQGFIEQLPIADESFDFISMGYALRHLADLVTAFKEFQRVLRPGGTLVMLEMNKPSTRLRRTLTGFYLGQWIPLVCRWVTHKREAQTLMRYYWDTVEHCVPAKIIMQTLVRTNFSEVRCEANFGLFSAYIARKPGTLHTES